MEEMMRVTDDRLPSLTVAPLHQNNALQYVFRMWLSPFMEAAFPVKGLLLLCDHLGKLLDSCACTDDERLAALAKRYDLWDRANSGRHAVSEALERETAASVDEIVAGNQDEPDGYVSIAEPIVSEAGGLLAVVALFVQSGPVNDGEAAVFRAQAASFRMHMRLMSEKDVNSRLNVQLQRLEQRIDKRNLLFDAAEKLHSEIDVEYVLTEVIRSMKRIYPNVNTDLYLSQDYRNSLLPVKPLHFQQSGDDICTKAFMEGRPVTGTSTDNSRTNMAVPLCGKQGIYGVLLLDFLREQFDEMDVKLITMLADTAGSAFENARLYEQSNLLITELRLINEITRKLNESLKLADIFNFACTQLIDVFNAEYCCILQLIREENQLVVQASNLSLMLNEMFAQDYGFSGIVFNTQEPVFISDYWKNPKISSRFMEVTKSRSLIASPIMIHSEVEGVILVTHSMPNYFSYDNYRLLQVLAGHIGLAISNASLHAEVKRMVITDNLTGLYARHYLDEQINALQKKDFCGSLILLDIDDFKRINDTYGHQVGDQTLLQVSSIIRTCIRETDIAARWGGEELAVYLPQVAIDQTLRVAERIRHRVESETNPGVTISCGISEWNWEDDKISVESLFYKADMALYEAKHNGKNQFKIG